MSNARDQFFADTTRQQEYQDFLRRYQDDPHSISDEEAARRYRELVSQLDDDDLDDAHQAAFGPLPKHDRRQLAHRYEEATRDPGRPYQGYPQDLPVEHAVDPRELGRMTRRAAREDPDLLEQVVGPDAPFASTAGKVALDGAAALIARRILFGGR